MARLLLLVVALGALASAATGAAESPRVVAKIRLAPFSQPCAAAGAGGSVWVAEYAQPYAVQIAARTNRVVRRVKVGNGACGITTGAGSLWIEDTYSATVSRISLATYRRRPIPVGAQPYDVTFAYGSAWVTAFGAGEVERIDPAGNRVVARVKLAGATGVVAAFGSVWATGHAGVVRIDPATNRVTARVPLAGAAWTAASEDAVWFTSPGGLVRVDPATNAVVATISLPPSNYGDPTEVAGKLWVPEVTRNAIAIVDPATNAVTETIHAGSGPFVVSAIDGEAWVPSYRGADVWRFAP
jgi:YVTN family beta-propeller protein